ncbi:DUF3137 domain-containing protein [Henriciella mobilis]|uniref:DUF3137 domain-containing protein n=1 Tax=Henriciella mobilis TaxID=2305467 RepID=UPI000E66C8E1|nr:DUF3137 domain-containing protein [Henriciella mobilis]RIJ13779.1 DUF3137 domain-containing protein [Henriciella mobilis]RIJ21012.1 DUF3137 domain-containing protein [Henriciella mobilis]
MQAALDIYFDSIRSKRPEFEPAIAVWRDVLQPQLERMEEERKAVIGKAIKRTAIVGSIALLSVIALTWVLGFQVMFPFGIFAGIVLTVLASAAVWIPVFSMKSQTKQLVVGAACECFGFNYDTMHPDLSGISGFSSLGNWVKSQAGNLKELNEPPTPAFERLKAYALLPSYDSRKFEDLISGTRAEADFTMVECKLTEQQGSGKNRRTVTKFQGLLFNIDYPEPFLGRTIIARDKWWKRGKGASDLQRVDLVSKELEDAFTVHSTDQVEARTLLTPDRMERLIALERHFQGGKLRGIFEDGHMTIALEAGNQFEAGSIFKPLVDPDRFIQTLTEIGLVCDMIDGFLTREWYKDRI